MTPDDETLRAIARWLLRLAGVTRQSNDAPIGPEMLTDYANLLARDLPASAFTTETLHAVAHDQQWFPPYALIAKRVGECWSADRPRLQGPPRAGLDASDLSWLAYWHRNRNECVAREQRLGEARLAAMDPAQRPLAMLGSLVRGNSPKAWARIVKEEMSEEPDGDEVEGASRPPLRPATGVVA